MARIMALAGGVGGAKLAHGLYRVVPPDDLTVVVNTADDFSLFGLHISPDADTVMYTLGGLANLATGWGVAGDTFETLRMLERFGRETWFQIGDRDFATHLTRTERLRTGVSLTEVTHELTAALGIRATIVPMCDEPVATKVITPDGPLEFQEYFVRRHQEDVVTAVEFRSIERASVSFAVQQASASATAIIFCPSNPIVSIGPILAVPGLRELLVGHRASRIAVSPIIGGQALRGPADRMLRGLGHEVSAFGVAAIYQGLVDGMVIDELDAELAPRIESLGMQVCVAQTVMSDENDRVRLAERVLAFAADLRSR